MYMDDLKKTFAYSTHSNTDENDIITFKDYISKIKLEIFVDNIFKGEIL